MIETVVNIEARYCDIDPMGVVHHAVYPLWCEIARIDFLNTIGIDYKEFDVLGISPAAVNLNVNFLSAVTYPCKITVRTRIDEYGPKKIRLIYEMFAEGRQDPVNVTTTTHVWVDRAMRSVNMQKDYPQYYSRIEAAAN